MSECLFDAGLFIAVYAYICVRVMKLYSAAFLLMSSESLRTAAGCGGSWPLSKERNKKHKAGMMFLKRKYC